MVVARVLEVLLKLLDFARLLMKLAFGLLSSLVFILEAGNLILELFGTLLQSPLLLFKTLN